MEKYEKAKMEVIEFEAEDVITTSGGPTGGGGSPEVDGDIENPLI